MKFPDLTELLRPQVFGFKPLAVPALVFYLLLRKQHVTPWETSSLLHCTIRTQKKMKSPLGLAPPCCSALFIPTSTYHQFRVISMFSPPGDSSDKADGPGDSASKKYVESEQQEQEKYQEEHAWWPKGVGGGIGRGAVASGTAGTGAAAEGQQAEEGSTG